MAIAFDVTLYFAASLSSTLLRAGNFSFPINEIVQEELVPALGCTEPIALAYAAASAREVSSAKRISPSFSTRSIWVCFPDMVTAA